MATHVPKVSGDNTVVTRRSTRSRSSRIRAVQEGLIGYAFLSPTMVFFVIFMFLPIGMGAWISLYNSSGFGSDTFTGLTNYTTLFQDALFWQTLGNTVLYSVLTVPTSILIGLAIALLLKDQNLPGRNAYRAFVYFPMVISGVATAIVGGWIFHENLGVANKIVTGLGFPAVQWQSAGFPAMLSIVIMTIWTRVGFNMVIYLASLQNIDPSYHEAALVDGAKNFQRFRSITWPLLAPTTFFLVIMNVIYSFQAFDLVYVMTGGGPSNSTNLLGVYAYQQGFESHQQGYATAIGMVLFAFMLIFTVVQWRTSKNREGVE